MGRVKEESDFDLVHATTAQVREVKTEISMLERMIKDNENPKSPGYGKILAPDEMEQEIQAKKKFLDEHAPERLTGAKANQAYAAAKMLKEFIVSKMPGRQRYFQSQKGDKDSHASQVDFDETVRQQMHFQTDPQTQQAIRQFKHIMRRLDPDNPEVTNIEALRPR